jgi:hypothetical protein
MIDIISNFMNVKDWNPDPSFILSLKTSCLLPLIENTFRTGSLLDMFKHADLYHSYIKLIQILTQNSHFTSLLIEIGPHFIPNQLEPICELIQKLNDLASIYTSCINNQTQEDEKNEMKNMELIEFL